MVHMLLQYLSFFLLSFNIPEILTTTSKPPTPYWKFGNLVSTPAAKTTQQMSFFWHLYEDLEQPSSSYGAYARHSPLTVWKNNPDSSPIKSVHYYTKKRKEDEPLPKKSLILNLSSRPRISHGPRRRRQLEDSRDRKTLPDVPLYCWKVLINCKRYRSHVCCPVMPNFMKDTSRQSRKLSYHDPLFGIPLAMPPPTEMQQDQLLTKRLWKPFCLTSDCAIYPQTECCSTQVDRFIPVEPFIQPTLIENWVSALFELFGNNPLVYLSAKKALFLASIGIGFILWGWLGRELGFVPPGSSGEERTRAEDRKDFVDLTSKVAFAIDDQDWLKGLTKELESKEYVGNINRFLCCFIESNEVVGGNQGAKIECYVSKRAKKFRSTVECVSDLVYDITLNRSVNATTPTVATID